jgi:hypothetical protein
LVVGLSSVKMVAAISRCSLPKRFRRIRSAYGRAQRALSCSPSCNGCPMLLRVAVSLVSLSAPKTARRIVKDSTHKSMAFSVSALGRVEEGLEAVQCSSNASKHVVQFLLSCILSEVQGLCVRSDCVFVIAIAILGGRYWLQV